MSPSQEKFDLKTHHFDSRGRLKAKNPYRLHIQGGEKFFERPVGSGNLWHEGGTPAGRVEVKLSDDGLKQTKIFHRNAKHIEYIPPLTGDDKLAAEHEELKSKNAAMAAELAAIKAEREKKESDQIQAKQEAKSETKASKQAPEPDSDEKSDSGPIKNYKDML